jgi:hypothetical protein
MCPKSALRVWGALRCLSGLTALDFGLLGWQPLEGECVKGAPCVGRPLRESV